MATEAEIIASNILASAIEYKRLYDTTKKNEYKVKEQRLRQIAENIKLIVSSSSSSSVSSFNGRTGAVTLTSADVTGALGYTPGDMFKSIYDYDDDGVVDSAERTEIIVRNSTGTTLTKGTVVYLSGATGNRPNALRAQANSEATSSKTFGFVVSDILNNADGYVACAGTLHDLDTSAFADGVALWLSPTVAGGWTTIVPSEPNHSVFLGYVARSHPTQGRIVILIQNGYELNELHDVVISSPSNGQILRYNSTNAYWENWTPTYLTAVPTLDQVTTAGNTTTNAITVGGLTVATNLIYTDTVNGRVGIGTTSPNSKLEVAGLSIFVNSAGSNYNENIRLPESTIGFSSVVMGGAIATSGSGATVWSILKNPSASGHRFTIRNNATDHFTILTSGNVGIGTTNPAYNLHTIGTIAVGTANSLNGTLRIERSGGNTGLILRGSDGTIVGAGNVPTYEPYNYATADHNFNIGHGSLGNFNWYVGTNATLNLNTHLMRLTRGGNLLIGTTTDSGYKLNVNGTAYVGSNLNVGTYISTPQITARRYYQNPDGVPSNNLGDPTVTEMALFDEQFDNKTAFYPNIYGSSILTFETYDGTTWTDISSTLTDTQKKQLFGGDGTSSIVIPYGTVQYQITINNPGPYVYLNALYNYWSGNGHNTQVHIWKKHNSGSWVQHTNSTTTVSSWPGHLYLPFTTIPWHPAGTLGTHYNQIRIVYTPTWNATYPTNNINLYKLQMWGGYPAGKRVIYSTNENRGVGFPADVTATGAMTSVGTFTANSTSTFAQLATFGNSATFNNAAGTSAIRFQHNGTNRGILGTDATIYGVSTANVGLYVYGANDLELSTNNVKRIIAKANGNILIGTTTDAGYRLDVNGTARVQGNLTVTNGTISVSGGDVTTNYSIQLGNHSSGRYIGFGGWTNYIGGDNTSNYLVFNTNSSEKMRITSSGNVGIGIAAPTDKLHIVDSSNANIFGRITATGTNASAAWVAMNNQNDNVVYRVFGDGVSGSQMGIALARSASLLANLGGSGKFLLGTFSATDFVMGTGNAEKARIVDSTGNFLIGTTSDNGNKLQVNGTIDGQAFAVNGVNGWTGTIMIAGNPPGMQNIDVQGGIIMNVF